MDSALNPETDPRFPSGRWVGFFTDKRMAGKHQMELLLTFRQGEVSGEGRDRVGQFLLRGRYDTGAGKCHWDKRYVGGHHVSYQGYAEDKGIWGTWQLSPTEVYGHVSGGFYIWPEGSGDPTGSALSEEADTPAPVEELVESGGP